MYMQIVFFCLPNDETSLQVILDQALPHAQPEQVLVDMSTVRQSTSLRLVCFCCIMHSDMRLSVVHLRIMLPAYPRPVA